MATCLIRFGSERYRDSVCELLLFESVMLAGAHRRLTSHHHPCFETLHGCKGMEESRVLSFLNPFLNLGSLVETGIKNP